MRRALLLAFAIATAAAMKMTSVDDDDYIERGGDESVTEKIFRPGYEYIYRYESQVLTGIRTVSDQVTAFKINSLVKMQFTRNDGVVLKMNDIEIYQHNDILPDANNYETVPNHELTRLTGEQEEVMVELLKKPIKFRYEDGEIRELKTVRGDRLWSVNIKKGLVSILQLKLNARSTSFADTDDVSSSTASKSAKWKLLDSITSAFGSRRTSSRMDNAFKLMETDVNGDCETKYVITSRPSSDQSSVSEMKVTRTKNFENCLIKHSYEQGLFANLPSLPSERPLIQPAYEAEYTVNGDRHHFLIKNAAVEAKYFFKPYGHEGGQVSTRVTQKLKLEMTKVLGTPIPVDAVVVEKHGLKMEIPRASWLPENSVRGSVEEHDWSSVIDSKLNELISTIYPVMHETSAAELMQLQMIVRHVPRRQLFTIIKNYVRSGSDEHNKKGEVLLDILPTCINPECGKVLIDLIRDGTIEGIRARLSINAMVLTVKPTPEITKALMTLYRESESLVRSTPFIRQTILLGVGTLTNKMQHVMRRVGKPIAELSNAVEEMSQELISLLSSRSDEKDKIRVLKAMGNMGTKELLNTLKSIIEDKSESKFVRHNAIHALRKLAKHFDRHVHPILMTVIMDKYESSHLRIAAMIVLKNSFPSYTTLELLVHNLHKEPSTQVKTFIYTTLISLANNKMHLPEHIQRAKDARKVLKLIRSIPVGIFDSKDIMMNIHSERLDMGTTWKIEKIKSETTGLPSIISDLHSTVFGNRLDLAKFGFDGKLMIPLARRLFGPFGVLKDIIKNKGSVYDIFTPLHKPEMMSEWKEMFGRKSFEPRVEEEMKSILFGELLGYEMFYREVDKDMMEKIFKYAALNAGNWIQKLKEGVSVNNLKTVSIVCNSLVMPTPMGVPLSLNVSAAGILKLDGYVKAKSLPSLTDFFYRRPFVSKPIEFETRIKPSWNFEVFGYMGVNMKWIHMGTALKANVMGKLPIKGEVSVNPSESKLTVRIEPQSENVKLFSAKIEPVTYIYYVPKTIDKLPFGEVELKPLQSHSAVNDKKFETAKSCELTGFQWNVKAQWTECGAVWCPYHPLTGKHSVSVNLQNVDSSRPKELVLTVKKFTQDWFNEGLSGEVDDEDETMTSTRRRPTTPNYRTRSRDLGLNVDEDESENEWEGREDEDFENVERDSYISTPRKVQVWVDLGFNGYRSSKLFKGKVTWLAENNYLEHQFNVQLVAKPCAEMNEFKVMLNGLLRCPITLESYSHYVGGANDVIGKLDVSWGRTGFQEKTIKLKMWELDSKTWKDELMTEGIDIRKKVMSMPFKPNQYRYAVEVIFPKITPVGQKYLTKTTDFIKMLLYRHITVGMPENIPQNKVIVYGEFMTKADLLNIVVKTPRETDLLIDLPVHLPWARYYHPALHDVSPSNFYTNKTFFDYDETEGNEDFDEYEKYKQYDEEDFELEDLDKPEFDGFDSYKYIAPKLSGVCEIHHDKLMTFDGTPILLPIHDRETSGSRCDVLFARDCSARESFSVTGSFKNGRWYVKVFVPKYKIEMIPERMSDRVMIKVNDNEVRVRGDERFELNEIPEDTSSEVVGVIEKMSGSLKINLRELGVTVAMRENGNITVKVSPFSTLQGQLCGLCGDNNYDVSNDMTSMDGKLFPNSREFVLDSIIPSGHCDKVEYETKLSERHEKSCLKKKIVKVDHGKEICFSKEPVTVCRKHCSLESTSSRTVRFVCLPRGDHKTKKLLKMYNNYSMSLVSDLNSLQSNYEKEIEVDDKCVPY